MATTRGTKIQTHYVVEDIAARESQIVADLTTELEQLNALGTKSKDQRDRIDELTKILKPTLRQELSALRAQDPTTLATSDQDRIREILRELAKDPVDPLFSSARALDMETRQVHHIEGSFGVGLSLKERTVVSIVGIMLRDNMTSPQAGTRFTNALALARQEHLDNVDLFDAVTDVLLEEGKVEDGASVRYAISARDLASVVKTLSDDGVSPNDRNLALKARIALGATSGFDDGAPPSAIDINLPDLEAQSDVDIVKANLDAMQAIYFAATLEEARLFEVTDKIVELFNQGVLPLGRGTGGDLIFRYWKKSIERMTEVERRNLYARSFGWPGGEAVPTATNRDFNDTWLRFLSAVQSYSRKLTVNDLLVAQIPGSVSQEQVRKAGRDLAANLSLYGYGMAYFAATELQTQIREIITILSNDDVKSCYGARDMWQVNDQVAALELPGGPRNSVRYRTMAQSGAVIIRWLSNNAARLSAIGGLDLLNDTNIRASSGYSGNPTVSPTDHDMVDACEQWLAVTGTTDQRIEQYAQPTEAPNTTSRPIQIPSIARDLLDSVGVNGAGVSMN